MWATVLNGEVVSIYGDHTNVAWGPNHFQSASSLSEEERALFSLLPLVDVLPGLNAESYLGNSIPTQKYGASSYIVTATEVRRVFSVVQRPALDIEDDKQRVNPKTALKLEITNSIQARLDEFAQTRHYDDIGSLSDYAGDEDPGFNTEGTYGKNMRSRTWRAAINILAEVEAGTRPMPTGYAEIEPLLPPLAWPV